MQIRTIEMTVGAFVLTGILALIFLAVQVSGVNGRHIHSDNYTLFAHFTNASGLTERAKVTIAGVSVGRIQSISLDPIDNRAKVEMSIDKNVNFITDDSIASVQTAGILGEKYISISVGGSPEILVDGGEIIDTQPALVLEDLIGKILLSMSSKKE